MTRRKNSDEFQVSNFVGADVEMTLLLDIFEHILNASSDRWDDFQVLFLKCLSKFVHRWRVSPQNPHKINQ